MPASSLRTVALALAALAGGACSLGLGETLTDRSSGAEDVPFNESDASSEAQRGSAAPPVEDVGARGKDELRGSPLCNAQSDAEGACFPDEVPSASGACTGTVDAGVDAGAAAAPLACRVRIEAARRAPVCAASGAGSDGTECMRSGDCAAGFECVRSPGRCRRYCCALRCDGEQSFCDAEPTAPTAEQPNLMVPVCAPVRACKLMGGGCGAGQTCAVVKDDGTTSCVGIGSSRAGEDCEREPCGAGLTCLGQRGSRTCYELCQVGDGSACPGGQTCRGTAPLFKDENVGVCE